jgi:hypothetical protein
MNPNTLIRPARESRLSRLYSDLLVISVTICGAMSASAQSLPQWSTVDDIENGSVSAMAADRLGNVFVAGDVHVGGVPQGCITKTSDQGSTWTNTVHGDVRCYSGIAAATIETAPATETTPAVLQDQLAAVAEANGQWITRRSLDAGVTWETVDIFKHGTWNGSRKPFPNSISIDSAGNLYVAGVATKTTTTVVKNKTTHYYAYYWLVRRIAGAATAENAESEAEKATFDLFDTAKGGYSWPQGVACIGTNVFIAGTSGDRWQVRKHTGGGAAWDLVDDWRLDAAYPSQVRGITVDHSGHVYVVGQGYRAFGRRGTQRDWIVRKGTGLGTGSFQTVDRFELEPDKGAMASGVCVDASGNMHVTGLGFSAVDSYTPAHWITRRLSAATGTWSTTDHYYLDPASTAQGMNIAADFSGNVFASGWANDLTSRHEWVVRRQLAP